MPMTGFMFQDRYLGRVAKLTDQELGRLVRALAIYHVSGEEQELAGRESVAYDFIKGDIDEAEKAYASKCEKNRQNRLSTIVNEREQPKTVVIEEKPKEEPKPEEPKQKRFTPPTVEEVRAYCNERGNKVDANKFVDFYTSKGWCVGNQKMKDWKAAVRTWEQRDSQGKPAKVVSAQQYTQRQYSEEELLAVSDDLMEEARKRRDTA